LLKPQKHLPYTLTADQRNEISERVQDYMVQRLKDAVERFNENGLPTMKDLPAEKRLMHYVMITDRADFQFIEAWADWPERIRAGLAPVPRSPRWQALASVPDLYRDVRSDFLSVLKRKVPQLNER
jgi:hypothetical protein